VSTTNCCSLPSFRHHQLGLVGVPGDVTRALNFIITDAVASSTGPDSVGLSSTPSEILLHCARKADQVASSYAGYDEQIYKAEGLISTLS
jgi:hypothetical protein